MFCVHCKQPELGTKGLDGINKDSHGEEGSLEAVGPPAFRDSMVLPAHGRLAVDVSLNCGCGGVLEPARASL